MTTIICDVCNKEIPIAETKIYGSKVKYYKRGKISYFEKAFANMDFCENCADNINSEILKSKTKFLSEFMRGE